MKLDFVSKYFPAPKFLKPAHIGISFSDSNIKAVAFLKSSPNPVPESLVVPLEKGSIVAGVILNQEEVERGLSEIRQKFDSPFVFFTIPDELAYIFLATLPVGSSPNLTESVASTIEENVPIPLSDTVFDFIPTMVVRTSIGYEASLVVAACVKKELDKFLAMLQKSGFEALGVMHESEAIARALTPQGFTGSTCIVHAREKRVGIYLAKAGVIHFSTIRAISEGDYSKQFLDEYDKFLEYCLKYTTDENRVIESTIVCGEFEYAKKVVSAITESSKIEKEVRLGNVWTNVLQIEKNPPKISYEDSLSLAGPIGAVLSDIV